MAISEAYNGLMVTNMTKRAAEMGLEGTIYPRNKGGVVRIQHSKGKSIDLYYNCALFEYISIT